MIGVVEPSLVKNYVLVCQTRVSSEYSITGSANDKNDENRMIFEMKLPSVCCRTQWKTQTIIYNVCVSNARRCNWPVPWMRSFYRMRFALSTPVRHFASTAQSAPFMHPRTFSISSFFVSHNSLFFFFETHVMFPSLYIIFLVFFFT